MIMLKLFLKEVYDALKEKGYNPINQIVGYIYFQVTQLILQVIMMQELKLEL